MLATSIFLEYYTNLGEIKDGGTPDLLLDLMRRYRVEVETIQIVIETMYNREGRNAVIQDLIRCGKIVTGHKIAVNVKAPEGWTPLEAQSDGSVFYHNDDCFCRFSRRIFLLFIFSSDLVLDGTKR